MALKLLRLHNGPWEISEAKYTDISMTEVVVQNVFSPACFLLFVFAMCSFV